MAERGCAGLDVHKPSVVATVHRRSGPATPPQRETATFGTTTRALLALRDWLADQGVTEVALESTGQYWKPVYYALEEIPGIKSRTADVLIAETGADLRQFPRKAHLCSWSGLCPGRDESAGKRRSGRMRPGNHALRTALIEAASAAARTRGTALAARYQRIKRHRGHQRAVVAVAHHLLVLTYHLLTTDTPYHDPGPDYFARRHRDRHIRRHVRQLEHLGFTVTLESAA